MISGNQKCEETRNTAHKIRRFGKERREKGLRREVRDTEVKGGRRQQTAASLVSIITRGRAIWVPPGACWDPTLGLKASPVFPAGTSGANPIQSKSNPIQAKSKSNPIRIQVQSNPGGSAIGPQSSIFKSDIERGHVRHRAESRPTSSGVTSDIEWDLDRRRLGPLGPLPWILAMEEREGGW